MRLRVKKKQEVLKEVSITKVEGVIIGKGVALSSDFLTICAENNIPVFFTTSSSTYFLPSTSLSKPTVRIKQMKLSSKDKKKFIFKLLNYKIKYQQEVAALFGFNINNNFTLNFSLPFDIFIQEAMNKEAIAAKEYWKNFSIIFRGFKRVKLFAEDNLNKTLNYGYGILKYSIEKAILSVGLDPYIGILHSTKDYRESFVFDAMEPFRPFVDFIVFTYLRNHMDNLEKDFNTFKRNFAYKLVNFFKQSNFLFDNFTSNFQNILLLQMRAFSKFFTEQKPFKIARVVKWSL